MSAKKPIRLLLVDDHLVVRMGLGAVLILESDFAIVGEAEDAEGAVTQYRTLAPDVTLLDVRMPGTSGVEALRRIRSESPDARIIMLTTSDLEEDIFQALEAGAAGYLVKTAQRAELADAIRCVYAGGRVVPPPLAERLAERAQRPSLTQRELEVLDYLRRGFPNKDIALGLGVTEHTVKAHVKAILVKLEAADRTEAVATGFERGLLQVG